MKVMKGVLVSAMVVGLLCFAATSADAPKGPPELKLTVAKDPPPKVDGVLDDAIWKNAAVFTDFKLPDGTKPKGKARLLVAQDDKALYIAVECFEDEKTLKSLVANVTDHDGDGIWNDDEVEVYLDPSGGAMNYYQIIVNSKGVAWDGYHSEPDHPDAAWNPKYDCVAKVGKESWVVELALPWTIFDRTAKFSDTWVFQCLNVRQSGVTEELQFAQVDGTSHQPEKFGKLLSVVAKPPAK